VWVCVCATSGGGVRVGRQLACVAGCHGDVLLDFPIYVRCGRGGGDRVKWSLAGGGAQVAAPAARLASEALAASLRWHQGPLLADAVCAGMMRELDTVSPVVWPAWCYSGISLFTSAIVPQTRGSYIAKKFSILHIMRLNFI